MIFMVHKVKESLSEVGSGVGGLFRGLAPVPIYGAVIAHAHKPVSGALKRAGREIESKKRKKQMGKRKKKKKKTKRKKRKK